MTLFDDRGDKPPKVESIVFSQRQSTRRSRTSWIPAARPISPENIPKLAPLPSMTEMPRQAVPPPAQADGQGTAHVPPAPQPAPPEEEPGLKEKVAAIMVRAERAADAFERAVMGIANARSKALAETEGQLVELALAIARRVLQREVDTNPALVIELARQGIAALAESDRVLIHVGASLDDSITASLAQTMARKGVQFEILRDESLPPDGCVVETEFGRVDESLEVRFRRVVDALHVSTTRG